MEDSDWTYAGGHEAKYSRELHEHKAITIAAATPAERINHRGKRRREVAQVNSRIDGAAFTNPLGCVVGKPYTWPRFAARCQPLSVVICHFYR